MSKRGALVAIVIAAAVASFFVIRPFAEQFAARHFGWDQAGQQAFGKFAFFPVLILLLFVLRRLGSTGKEQPPND